LVTGKVSPNAPARPTANRQDWGGSAQYTTSNAITPSSEGRKLFYIHVGLLPLAGEHHHQLRSAMANAMLEESFKSSHPDLIAYESGGGGGAQQHRSHDSDRRLLESPIPPHTVASAAAGATFHTRQQHPGVASHRGRQSGSGDGHARSGTHRGGMAAARRGVLQSICRSSHGNNSGSGKFFGASPSSSSGGGGAGTDFGTTTTTATIPLKDVSPSRKKSVDFALEHHHADRHHHPHQPPPPKRARTSDPWSPKQVVDGTSRSCCCRRRSIAA
jgi:hypothetical protein